jgi:hypothetical protein
MISNDKIPSNSSAVCLGTLLGTLLCVQHYLGINVVQMLCKTLQNCETHISMGSTMPFQEVQSVSFVTAAPAVTSVTSVTHTSDIAVGS